MDKKPDTFDESFYDEEEPYWLRIKKLEDSVAELRSIIMNSISWRWEHSQSLNCSLCNKRMVYKNKIADPVAGHFGFYIAELSCLSCNTKRLGIISDVSC